MTRISENQNFRILVDNTLENKRLVGLYSEQVSTGIKVRTPGDSTEGGTVSRFRELLNKIETYNTAIVGVRSALEYQENITNQVGELMLRAKELAAQGANETNSAGNRQMIADEVFAIRDSLVNLANSTYQGRYIYGGVDDDDPPFDTVIYTFPSSAPTNIGYRYDQELGVGLTRSVNIADALSITVNTPGNTIFENAIYALERLGRSLEGYKTTPPTGQPDLQGDAYTPAEFSVQTADIQNAMNLLDTARTADIQTERASIAARLQRLDAAENIQKITKQSTQETLSQLQDADETEAASNLALAQTALQASYTVTARVLNLSILDYL